MSKIALTPNASGTGTFTLAAPNSNTSRTITLPDEAGEVLVNGTNQNVGIGTGSPSAPLSVDSTGAVIKLNQSNVAADTYIDMRASSAAFGYDSSKLAATIQAGAGNKFISFNVNNNTFGDGEAMRIDSSGNVGIGTSSPNFNLHIHRSDYAVTQYTAGSYGTASTDGFLVGFNSGGEAFLNQKENSYMRFSTNNTERMRIDSSGNLLVGKTTGSISVQGFAVQPSGQTKITDNGADVLRLNRLSSDGTIIDLRKDGTTVGSIGVSGGDLTVSSSGSNPLRLQYNGNSVAKVESNSFNPANDNFQDLGQLSARWDDIYATNGTIQTSDRNEKQDIEVLSDAETRVAQACKGLLRKFRWQDAVAEKGDDARIHFGIIAQDLQDAFAAEGLDAGRYAMFISSTWWETQTEVPAVEAVDAVYEDVVIPAVLDEEGNELEAERTEQRLVTEAVEAKDAYTRTDTYETQAEAPEGATERTRLGVRYPELLAFIIGAM